jgi:hypothetical protein
MTLSIMNDIVMLGVNYAECHIPPIYFECHYAECDYAECHIPPIYFECNYAKCHYAECHYAECHYAECRYTECLGAVESSTNALPGHECTTNKKYTFFNFNPFPFFFFSA